MTDARQTPSAKSELDALVARAASEHRAGRLVEAAAAYRQVLTLRPDLAEAHNSLGTILAQQGDLDQALACFEQAIGLRADFAAAHNNLGKTLWAQGQLEAAQARFERALVLRPDVAEVHNNLGNVLAQQGKLDLAIARLQQAIALRPDDAGAHNNLGSALWNAGQYERAVDHYRQASALRPDMAEAHCNLGNVLAQLGKLEQAVTHYERALTLRPDYAEAYNNLGAVLWKQLRPAEAAARFEQAIALRPTDAGARAGLARMLLSQDRYDEALAHYETAVAAAPDNIDAQLGLAACCLLTGDYRRGWAAYEARLRLADVKLPPKIPRWTGQPLAGRTLLLVAEQGFGDTFQFVRYARVLKARGARVTLAIHRALGRLLAAGSDWGDTFILGSNDAWPECDYYLPLLSVPFALGTDASTIPQDVPYLRADPELTASWRRELAVSEGFKIGIAWQCLRNFPSDEWRGIPLAEFSPLARLPGVQLVSLQKGLGSEQLTKIDFPVLDLSDRLDGAAGSFMDTAAVIANLDLVVTSDTAVAHLAGALGAPVWLLLQSSPNWRWLRAGDNCPWYPTMRLFRQTTLGQWPDVFERVAHAVEEHRSAKIP